MMYFLFLFGGVTRFVARETETRVLMIKWIWMSKISIMRCGGLKKKVYSLSMMMKTHCKDQRRHIRHIMYWHILSYSTCGLPVLMIPCCTQPVNIWVPIVCPCGLGVWLFVAWDAFQATPHTTLVFYCSCYSILFLYLSFPSLIFLVSSLWTTFRSSFFPDLKSRK